MTSAGSQDAWRHMTDPFVWLALAAIPGHISWLQWVSNQLHARAIGHRIVKRISFVLNSCIVAGAVLALVWAAVRWSASHGFELSAGITTLDVALPFALQWYVGACAVNSLVSFLPWLVGRFSRQEAAVLLSDERVQHDLRPGLQPRPQHSLRGKLAGAVPFNQAFQLSVHTKRLQIPRLPAELHGLRVAHLTDIHLAGILDRRLYEQIVALANAAQPDLTVLTGDLIEKEACWDWIPSTLGSLRAAHGVHFVLGNHDLRIDHTRTRRLLTDAGLVDLGGRCVELEMRGAEVLLAGNELPWFGPPAPMQEPEAHGKRRGLRMLLSHSPDQLPWARRYDFDLMVAGHVHGGQIQIPPLGPVLAPSRYGVRYACGVFHEPPTVMHVGRGTSSKLPLRFFCAPELTILVLESPAAGESASHG